MAKLGMDPVRVENHALPGTPDVNFIEGWVELKHADSWPVRGGPLRLGHPPTPEQKVWLARRWHVGGNCGLVLRVGREWFLFRGCDVRSLWAGHPLRSDLEAAAVVHTTNPRELAERLKNVREA
ncbi:recombination protein U [Pseudanabaena phage Pam3]|nr:recombination protein U [Pseudanabaena phage Pam3]